METHHPTDSVPQTGSGEARTAAAIQTWLVAALAERLGVEAADLDVREPFTSFGLASREAIGLSGDLEEWLGRPLSPTLIYEYPSIEALARYLAVPEAVSTAAAAVSPGLETTTEPIAIIGIGCRFPGAATPEAFWRLLRDGVDAITEVPAERWDLRDFYDPDPAVPGKISTRWGGFLAQVDQFDPHFFGISPREAARMDPQQRLLLEVAWEALEDAGQSPERLAGTQTGVFIGISNNDYGRPQLSTPELIDAYTGTGNAFSIAANRLSYFFDFQGPSMAVDTACSSSLVSVHMACSSLRHGESTLAVAGGVNLILSPAVTINFTKAGAMAPDGRCKAFDARANGYVRGEGAGVVILKPLSRALVDGDPIYAVIRGSALNQDGRTNGLMAPSRQAQEAVLRAAYQRAGVSPGQVHYVETHGTGTLLGDPIEAKALGAVLAIDRPPGQPCAIGAVKTNIGHLEAAAGVAGLIKVALALKHETLPPSLHFQEPNPHIPFETLPLRVQQILAPWPQGTGPALAGVSSFGFGGTNAHIVLEAAPQPRQAHLMDAALGGRRAHLLPLSAHSPEALRSLAQMYQDILPAAGSGGSAAVADICYTASVRRSHHDHRLALVTHDPEELHEGLAAFLHGEPRPDMSSGHALSGRQHKVVFVFPGQGAQWVGMGRQLCEQEPVFRIALERCDQAMRPHVEWSVLEGLRTGTGQPPLDRIDVVQPTLFAIQVALAGLWRSWGIEPDAVVGHSMGEVAAAHVAGALSLEDAARVICRRSLLLRRLSGQGGMAAVELPLEQAQAALAGYEDRLAIAVSNSPTSTVLSGDLAGLEELIEKLQCQDIFCRWVKVDVASHSPQVDPLHSELLQALEDLHPRPAAVPFYSTVAGLANDSLWCDAAYWWQNLRRPVHFAAAVQALLTDGHDIFLEMSPHPILSPAIQQGLHHLGQEGVVLPSLRRDEAEQAIMLGSLGTLYTLGYPMDWGKLYPLGGQSARLPAYPWQREHCWLDHAEARLSSNRERARWNGTGVRQHPLLGRHVELAHLPGHYFWEGELDHPALPYLADHRLQGSAVLPTSVYVEIGLAAAAEVFGGGPCVLAEIELHRALVMPENGSKAMQVMLSPTVDGAAVVHVYSQPDRVEGQPVAWTLHATAQLSHVQTSSAPTPIAIEDLHGRCPDEISAREYYLRLHERGVQYGPSLQGIDRIWQGDGEALGKLQTLQDSAAEASVYQLHPVLLDACFQLLGATVPVETADHDAGDIYVLSRVEQVRFSGHSAPCRWSHARLQEQHADSMVGEVRLLDDAGHVIVEVLGVCLQRLDRTAQQAGLANLDDWFYELQWQPQPRSDAWQTSEPSPQISQGSWLIFADCGGVGEALAERLMAGGERCVLVSPGQAYKHTYKRDDREDLQLRPGQPEDMQQLFDAALGLDQPPCRGVVHLWSLDMPPPEQMTAAALETAQLLGCGSTLHAVQRLAQGTWGEPPRLWLVTRGAQPAGEGAASLAVAQAPLWGFGRTLAQEHPALWGGLVDLEPATSAADAVALLWEELWGAGGEDQVAWRCGQRYVARFVRRPPAAKPASLWWRPDGSYLITGGLGGLGLSVARWMVEQGARRLILMGRTKLPPRSHWNQVAEDHRLSRCLTAIRELEALGASVHLATVDVADERQLSTFLEAFRSEGWPPIRGVVHAAGVAQGETLQQLDLATLHTVLQPKVTGSWLLHHLLADFPLDFFVLFSSAASLLGILGQGQGNYAAANAFMDALAHYRQGRGQPALSINWGPWSQIGLAAAEERVGRLARRGIESIAPEQGLEALGRLFHDGGVQVGVLPINWSQVRQSFPTASDSPLLSILVHETTDLSSPTAASREKARLTRDALLAADPGERQHVLQSYLNDHVARVLGLAADKLDVQEPLNHLGLDSMMAVELRNRIEVDLGVAVPMVKFLEGVNMAQIAAVILEQLHAASLTPVVSPKQALLSKQSHDATSRYPLSYVQHAMWLQCQLAPENTAYSVPLAARIRSKLDVVALQRALQALVDRHAVLRTTYTVWNGEPMQQVHESMGISFHHHDTSTWSEDVLEERLAEELHRPFDLECGPMLRANVFTQSPNEHFLLLTVHHIAIDFWSLEILIDELRALYAAERTGVSVALPPLGAQYTDFVSWLADMLAGPEGEQLWGYWQRQLSGELPTVDLPTDRPRPSVKTYRGATHFFTLDNDLVQQLRTLAISEKTTLYVTLQAVLQVLLYRYTGQEDLLVGVPTAGRNQPEFANVVGCFVESVMLRGDLTGNPSFRTVLNRIRQAMLAALAHQNYPIALLVKQLNVPRDPSQSPLIQVMFGWDKPLRLENGALAPAAPGETDDWLQLEGLSEASFSLDHQVAMFDLLMVGLELPESLSIAMQYNTDLFDAKTIVRMADHLRIGLGAIVANPDQRISELPLLTKAENHQLLVEWNNTQVDASAEAGIHQLFEAQAERTPDSVAVEFEGARLTYRELNQRANQLAHHLRALDVGPEVRVGLCLQRSLEMVVGLLGILKAGGAYVPLEPTYPKERLAFLLADARVPVLLTQAQVLAELPEHGAQAICLDTHWASIAQESADNPASRVMADNLAYVIYTSGSTGTPKGVLVTHRNVVNSTRARFAYYRDPVTSFMLMSSLAFDSSVAGLFWTLAQGGMLLLPPEVSQYDLVALAQLLAQHHISHWLSIPSLYALVLAQVEPAQLASLNTVIVAGEPCPSDLVERHYARLPQASLFNEYGPTEGTVWSSVHHCQPQELRMRVPIGRAIANTHLYVLDSYLQLVPIGVSGELYIGGVGLSRGYLNRPELTAERFIPHPFSDAPGARLYKTGDLVRYLPDGSIEFLGRLDHQVKLRGFRIELGEIEAVLSHHQTVREAVVVMRDEPVGEQRLVAYVVLHPEQAPTVGELRSFLQGKLPDYMVPAALVILEALPLTPNGKADRQALPAPDVTRSGLEKAFAAPRDALELQLAQLWEEFLDVRPIGITDSFFDLGGHSLLAVRLMAGIQQQFGQELPLTTLFQNATIEHLASLLREQTSPVTQSSLVAIQPAGTKRPFFCVHPMGGQVLCYAELALHLGTEQPFYGLQHPGFTGDLASYTHIEELATHYLRELRACQSEGPYLLGGWSMGGLVAFEMAQQLEAQDREVALLVLIDIATTALEPSDSDLSADFALEHFMQLDAEALLRSLLELAGTAQDRTVFLRDSVQALGLSTEHLPHWLHHLVQLGHDEDLRSILAQAHVAGRAPSEVERAQMQRHLHVLTSNIHAMRNYVPQVYPRRITLFRACEQDIPQEPGMGWERLTTGGLDIHTIPGDHYTMFSKPHVEVLSQRLHASLQAVQADTSVTDAV